MTDVEVEMWAHLSLVKSLADQGYTVYCPGWATLEEQAMVEERAREIVQQLIDRASALQKKKESLPPENAS